MKAGAIVTVISLVMIAFILGINVAPTPKPKAAAIMPPTCGAATHFIERLADDYGAALEGAKCSKVTATPTGGYDALVTVKIHTDVRPIKYLVHFAYSSWRITGVRPYIPPASA